MSQIVEKIRKPVLGLAIISCIALLVSLMLLYDNLHAVPQETHISTSRYFTRDELNDLVASHAHTVYAHKNVTKIVRTYNEQTTQFHIQSEIRTQTDLLKTCPQCDVSKLYEAIMKYGKTKIALVVVDAYDVHGTSERHMEYYALVHSSSGYYWKYLFTADN